ncbi:MAG: hypothetical protein NTW19_10530 [Planctomycetota bacterium]|nr:hypothetical protein [Planctomycetota bacterium]
MLGRQTEWMWAATAAAALALAPPWTEPARGQVAGGASGQNAGPVDDPPRMLAERLLTLVDDALEGKGQPRTDQLVRARILLEQALKLAPDDAESWRLRLELADRLDDKAGSFDALKAYCRLRPEDDVAQWDLIQRSINQKQTIEQRTTAVANLADGTSAGGLSPALRSRLATYLARAASERGDNREFALRLKAALQLDPANPRAAAMAYELTLARQAPPLDRGATLLAVVRSAPTDSMARWQLGNILLSQGAYLDAVGQLAAAKSVSTSPFSPQEATNYYASMVISLASAGQTAQALALLNQLDAAWSPAAPGATTAPAATAPAVKPESAPATAPSDAAPSAPTIGAGLPIDLEILRVALLKRDGGFERAAASLTRVREDVARRAKRPGPEGAMAQTEQAWIDLLFFNEGDTAAAAKALQALPALVEKTPADQPLGKRLRGFLSLRAGRVEEARAALIQLIATDPFACYGMGHSYPAESRERREWLAKSAESGASGLSGLLSCLELRALGFPVTATPAGLAVGDRLAEWPRLLVNPNPAEQAWIILALTVEPHR